MYICLCKGVTDSQIKGAVAAGANDLRDIRKKLGVATQCCKCLPDARTVIDEALVERAQMESLYYSA